MLWSNLKASQTRHYPIHNGNPKIGFKTENNHLRMPLAASFKGHSGGNVRVEQKQRVKTKGQFQNTVILVKEMVNLE